jgi:hypothetical protein|tara:strand:- start:162 stop:383 length:222 start_codon:yes stop_codon:yes gene_type:complete
MGFIETGEYHAEWSASSETSGVFYLQRVVLMYIKDLKLQKPISLVQQLPMKKIYRSKKDHSVEVAFLKYLNLF